MPETGTLPKLGMCPFFIQEECKCPRLFVLKNKWSELKNIKGHLKNKTVD